MIVLLFLAATLMKVPAVLIAHEIPPVPMTYWILYLVIQYAVGTAPVGVLILMLLHLPLLLPFTRGIHLLLI